MTPYGELSLFWWRAGIWLLLAAKAFYELRINKVKMGWPGLLVSIQLVSVHLTLVLLVSSLLYQLTRLADMSYATFLTSLSVYWAVYGLALVGTGLWRRQKLWRLLGITLLGITVIKLFIADLREMSTPGKILVFVLLGVFLLLISYLYQKYKHLAERDDL